MSDGVPAAVLDLAALNRRSFAERAADLTQPERAAYRRIVENFIAGAPSRLDTSAGATARLIEADLIQTDAAGRVTVAYPFSAEPTRHRVALRDGRDYYAMCAFDALGIPYMLHERGEISAREPNAEGVVRVVVDPDGEPTWMPMRAVAVAAFGEGRCLAHSACPHINLFVSPGAGAHYLRVHALDGDTMTVADAATVAEWLFGHLLEGLGDSETGS